VENLLSRKAMPPPVFTVFYEGNTADAARTANPMQTTGT
jgi:hypothetical protein